MLTSAAAVKSCASNQLPTAFSALPRASTATNSCLLPPLPLDFSSPFRNIALMKGKPRVLLLSASSGAGHVRAAQALEKAFCAHGDCVVEHIDAIDHVSKLFQGIYDKA